MATSRSCRNLPPLTIPAPTRNEPSQFTPADDRWNLARRMLTDDTLNTADRVAACLVLLYAQHVTRIVTLTRDHVQHTPDGQTKLRLAKTDLDLFPPLDELTPSSPPTTRRYRRFPPPGPMAVSRQETRQAPPPHEPRPDRNSALREYARRLPPPVIGKLLGLHPGTTDRWASIAAGKWARHRPATT